MDAVYDEEALAYACAEHYDGIILDIMMPKTSGLEVLSSLRKKGCRTPVMLLTAKSEGEDRIQGLDLGADDYLPKPFVMGELLARIRAMLRRRETYRPDVLTCGELYSAESGIPFDGAVYTQSGNVSFKRGFGLQRYGAMRQRQEIGTVWVYISYLRKRLAALSVKVEIRARRNIGYGGNTMIKTLQRRFILTAMAAISVLLLVLLGAIKCRTF